MKQQECVGIGFAKLFRQLVIMMGAGRRKGALERGGGIGTDRMGRDDWERGNRLHFQTSIIVHKHYQKLIHLENDPVRYFVNS